MQFLCNNGQSLLYLRVTNDIHFPTEGQGGTQRWGRGRAGWLTSPKLLGSALLFFSFCLFTHLSLDYCVKHKGKSKSVRYVRLS